MNKNEVPGWLKQWMDEQRDRILEKGLGGPNAELFERAEEQKAELGIEDSNMWNTFLEMLFLKFWQKK